MLFRLHILSHKDISLKTYICYLFSLCFGFLVGILGFRCSFRGKHSHYPFGLLENLFGGRWTVTIGCQLIIGWCLTWYLKTWLLTLFRRRGLSSSSGDCSCTLYGTKPETTNVTLISKSCFFTQYFLTLMQLENFRTKMDFRNYFVQNSHLDTKQVLGETLRDLP